MAKKHLLQEDPTEEEHELQVAGTLQSTRPVCDAIIRILACIAAVHRMRKRLGPDDASVLAAAAQWANRCEAFAWGHAMVALAETASDEQLGTRERSSVLQAARLREQDTEPTPPDSRVLGFNGLSEETQNAVLAYARGYRAGAEREAYLVARPTGVLPKSDDEMLTLVRTALDETPASYDTAKTQMEACPNAHEAFGWSETIQRFLDRESIDLTQGP